MKTKYKPNLKSVKETFLCPRCNNPISSLIDVEEGGNKVHRYCKTCGLIIPDNVNIQLPKVQIIED